MMVMKRALDAYLIEMMFVNILVGNLQPIFEKKTEIHGTLRQFLIKIKNYMEIIINSFSIPWFFNFDKKFNWIVMINDIFYRIHSHSILLFWGFTGWCWLFEFSKFTGCCWFLIGSRLTTAAKVSWVKVTSMKKIFTFNILGIFFKFFFYFFRLCRSNCLKRLTGTFFLYFHWW